MKTLSFFFAFFFTFP
ncbi:MULTISPECIES: hypothetical protein [Pantoea]|uniref:Uncharacterized protein n=1 Tax=Pantoea allii TaxID=574096 RepID=A0ABS6VJZ8_9GAMM|nr:MULTISPECIES: hypothetical protein [Pantoea]MBN6031606.1 hypothetical protein [Pantoea ananatis]MBW1214811.1 hypothetical protein [Pantoea allii]MBW1255549.1 hypothetical protein [Pantoea allii]MBW1259647.1 hypothetical protein [Pantoea allii]MBW1264626.1 hypothetical protein [Pantoea allii]